MPRPAAPTTAEVISRVLAGHDDLVGALADVHDAARAAVDPGLLERCELRIAMLLGAPAEAAADASLPTDLASWPTAERFDERDRACLAFCEQFVIDVAALDDELARAVADHLGPQGLADLTAALLVVEQRLRLRLAWERLGLVGSA